MLLGTLAVVLVAADVTAPVRSVLVAAALLVLPGLVLLPSRWRSDLWAVAGASVVLSGVVGTFVGLVLVWTGWWHPLLTGSALLVLSTLALTRRLLADARTRASQLGPRPPEASTPGRGRGRVQALLGLGLVVAGAAWISALAGTETGQLGAWGLLPAFPAPFYAALVMVLTVLVLGVATRRSISDRWMLAYGAVLVLILYGSAPLVEAVPRLPWIYKHIAVTRYLELHGAVDVSVDIYQRWPGFFAWTALLGSMIARPDPTDWGHLAEPFFALLGALLVLAIARTFSRRRAFGWTTMLFFSLGNWINQNYFAPQALAYDLYLFVALVLLTAVTAAPRPLGLRVEAVVAGLLRAKAPSSTSGWAGAAGRGAPPMSRGWAVVATLAAFAVTVASHQLTPYLALVVLAPLFLLGWFRPLWLVVLLGVVTVAYLAPNLSYIERTYGILSGLNPLDNATSSLVDRTTLSPAQVWSGRSSYALSGLLYLTAFVGLVRRAHAGGLRSAVALAWMMLAPALVLAVQSYGGEGRLRVYLFSLPWCAVAAAWAFWPGTREPGRRPRALLAVLLVSIAAFFTVSYFLPEQETQVDPADVAAARWLDETSRPGDVLLAMSPDFPRLVGAHYDNLVLGDELSHDTIYFDADLGPDDVRGIAAQRAGGVASRTLLVFSHQQDAFNARHDLWGPGELVGLEAQIRADPAVVVLYARDGVRIYALS